MQISHKSYRYFVAITVVIKNIYPKSTHSSIMVAILINMAQGTMFRGAITALVTPFKNGEVDYNSLQDLVEWQIEQGIHGLTVLGTTGESVTLDDDERERIIKTCISVANKRIPIIVGTGTSSTKKTISYSQQAKELGADGSLIVSPYYNKPTQEGIVAHFKAVNDSVDLPIIIYNSPARTNVNILDSTLSQLVRMPNVKGIKDATGDILRPLTLRNILRDANRGDFAVLTGDDPYALAFNASGGHGCISVSSNIIPGPLAKLQELTFAKNYDEALTLQTKYIDLHNVMFCETNPGPVKYALSLLGKSSSELRLPLVEPRESSKTMIKETLQKAGVI